MKEVGKDLKVVVTPIRGAKRAKMFSVRMRLSDDLEKYKYPVEATQENFEEGSYNKAYILASALFKINGVQYIVVDSYDVTVAVGRAFTFNEVQAEVISTIKWYLKTQKDLEDKSKNI